MNHHLILLLLLGLASCQALFQPNDGPQYTLALEDGIYVEQFDSTYTRENRYTANNQAYRAGQRRTYRFYYQDQDGKRHVYQEADNYQDLDYDERNQQWSLVPLDQIGPRSITQVRLTVKEGLAPMSQFIPDYHQTVITYDFLQQDGAVSNHTATGVIENEKNVWVHPPRARLFRILEVNPFPMIQAPYRVGHQWAWTLGIGESWGDVRWKTWEGSIQNRSQYEIVGREAIETPQGRCRCWVVEAQAQSRIGRTGLTAYFDPEMGFVKLDYLNLDSTRLVLELDDFQPSK